MNTPVESTRKEEESSKKSEKKIVIVTAVISTIFGVLYFLGLMGKLIVNGSIHAESSPAISMVSGAVGLLWVITLVILFTALRRLLPGRKEIYADLGLVFMLLLGACSSVNWYVQLTLVPRLETAGDSALLALLDIHNVDSLMYAMEHLSWSLFFGLALIFTAVAFDKKGLDAWIRWLFIAAGIMSIVFIPGIMAANQLLIDLGYYAAGVLMPITTTLLVIRIRKN